jgi:hypothetical protein
MIYPLNKQLSVNAESIKYRLHSSEPENRTKNIFFWKLKTEKVFGKTPWKSNVIKTGSVGTSVIFIIN